MAEYDQELLSLIVKMKTLLEPEGNKRAGLKKAWAEFMGTNQTAVTRILADPKSLTLAEYLSFCEFAKQDPCALMGQEPDMPPDLRAVIAELSRRPIREQKAVMDLLKIILRYNVEMKAVGKGEKADEQAEIPFAPHEG